MRCFISRFGLGQVTAQDGQIGMPHQFLQGKDVDSVAQHGDGKSPSENVQGGFSFESRLFCASFEDLVQASIGNLEAFLETLHTEFFEARKNSNDYSQLKSEEQGTRKYRYFISGGPRHLGLASSNIAALRVEAFFSLHPQRSVAGNNSEITIFILKFNGINNLLIQAIEDGFLEFLNPAFGRKGEQ